MRVFAEDTMGIEGKSDETWGITEVNLSDSFCIKLPGLWLGGGGIPSIGIATFLMLTFQVSHQSTFATTLIISLGVLQIWTNGLVILAAFIILYYTYWIFQWLGSTEIGIRSV